ncbi:MAG: hypothetical protein ACTSYD_07240 [Candidatus Heimdallarchaeaceae archaeon]
MSIITEEDPEDQPTLKITRSAFKDVIQVCPLCFSPVRSKGLASNFLTEYACTNPDCGWTGTIVIEVDKEEYLLHMSKKDNKQINKES